MKTSDAPAAFPPVAKTRPADCVISVLEAAFAVSATDIHIDFQGNGAVTRFRTDSGLTRYDQIGLPESDDLNRAIRAAAGFHDRLNRLPQNGQFDVQHEDSSIRIDVSVLPAHGGERMTLSLGTTGDQSIPLDQLGLLPMQLELLSTALTAPSGFLLFSGQKCAGVKMTLYAAMRALCDGKRNVFSVETAIGHVIDGAAQIEIGRTAGLDHGAALQAVLRHRPDAVMIDDLQDAHTPELAVKAALSQTLVLGALTAADSIGAVVQLAAQLPDGSLLPRALSLVSAQKLIDRLCTSCTRSHLATSAEAAPLGLETGALIHDAAGCSACEGTGIAGQIGLFELVHIDQPLRDLLASGADRGILARYAFSDQPNFAASARHLVLEGHINVATAKAALD